MQNLAYHRARPALVTRLHRMLNSTAGPRMTGQGCLGYGVRMLGEWWYAMSTSRHSASTIATYADARDTNAALQGDQEAFGRLVARYQATIAQQMRRFSRHEAVVEELVHDVFVEAFLSLKSFQSRGPFLHWLRKIAVRKGYGYWKSKARIERALVPLSELDLSVSEDLRDGAAASQTLGDLLSHLPARDRLVLTLIYWDGCTIAEAADLSGWSQAMVKVQAHRARKRLRKLIEESQQ